MSEEKRHEGEGFFGRLGDEIRERHEEHKIEREERRSEREKERAEKHEQREEKREERRDMEHDVSGRTELADEHAREQLAEADQAEAGMQ